MSGYCQMGWHPDCSDSYTDTGECPCQCHFIFDEDDDE